MRLTRMLLVLFTLLAVAPAALAGIITFTATLDGSQEVPPNASPAGGYALLALDDVVNQVFFAVSYSGLTGVETATHFHQAPAGVNGPVLFGGGPFGGLWVGSESVTPAEASALAAGNWYVNVHSTVFPGGEIRGQLGAGPTVMYFAGAMDGGQEVPPNASTASGFAELYYDAAGNLVVGWASYSGLTGAFTAAHFHQAAAGVNGPVKIMLVGSGGLAIGGGAITQADADQLVAGNWYANVHTTLFPGGEVRGQLGTGEAIPEPGTFLLLGAGLAAVAALRWRKAAS